MEKKGIKGVFNGLLGRKDEAATSEPQKEPASEESPLSDEVALEWNDEPTIEEPAPLPAEQEKVDQPTEKPEEPPKKRFAFLFGGKDKRKKDKTDLADKEATPVADDSSDDLMIEVEWGERSDSSETAEASSTPPGSGAEPVEEKATGSLLARFLKRKKKEPEPPPQPETPTLKPLGEDDSDHEIELEWSEASVVTEMIDATVPLHLDEAQLTGIEPTEILSPDQGLEPDGQAVDLDWEGAEVTVEDGKGIDEFELDGIEEIGQEIEDIVEVDTEDKKEDKEPVPISMAEDLAIEAAEDLASDEEDEAEIELDWTDEIVFSEKPSPVPAAPKLETPEKKEEKEAPPVEGSEYADECTLAIGDKPLAEAVEAAEAVAAVTAVDVIEPVDTVDVVEQVDAIDVVEPVDTVDVVDAVEPVDELEVEQGPKEPELSLLPDKSEIEEIVMPGDTSATTAGFNDLPFVDGPGMREKLGAESYAEALAKFVSSCETPMSIALQGERGSGRTTLLRLMEQRLSPSIIRVHFTVHDYDRLDSHERLPAILLRRFIQSVCRDASSEVADSALESLKKAAGALKEAQSVDDVFERVDILEKFRQELARLVEIRLEEAGPDARIVLFADDLDLAAPVRAVEILEAVKRYLSMEGCVFVAVCGFQAIEEGVKEKALITEFPMTAKWFFERTFQISFNIPTETHDVAAYLEDLLTRAGLAPSVFEESDIEDMACLLRYSVGFKPREIKRQLNRLLLMDLASAQGASRSVESARTAIDKKAFFGVTCLESAYHNVYRYLMGRLAEPGVVRDVLEAIRSEERLWVLDERLGLLAAESEPEKKRRVKSLTAFMKRLVQIVKRDSREELTISEVETLRNAFRKVRIVSQDHADLVFDEERDEVLKLFCHHVRSRVFEVDFAPTGYSRVLGGNQGVLWFDFWYQAGQGLKSWGKDTLTYYLLFDLTYGATLKYGLRYRLDRLKKQGVSDETIQELQNLGYWTEKEFAYNNPRPGVVVMERKIGPISCASVAQLSEKEADHAAKELVELISRTHSLFGSVKQSSARSRTRPREIKRSTCDVCGKEHKVAVYAGVRAASFRCKQEGCNGIVRIQS